MEDLFIYKWHKTEEVEPGEGDDVFFFARGNVYAGKFDEETKMFYMADYMGYPLEEVQAWKYISNDLNFSTYPENGAHVAISTREYDCFVTGIYNESIDYLGAVILDPIYELDEDQNNMVLMKDIVSWTAVPEYRLEETLPKARPSNPGTAKPSWGGNFQAIEVPRNPRKTFPGRSNATELSGDLNNRNQKKEFPGSKPNMETPEHPEKASNEYLDSEIGTVETNGEIGPLDKNPIKAKIGQLRTNSLGIPEYDTYTGIKYTKQRQYVK